MRVLFTGCTSQAGRFLFQQLREQGHDVVGVSRQVVAHPSIRADLTQNDFGQCLPDEHFDALVHFGSYVPINERASRWEDCSKANLHGTARLLEWAEGRVRRIILASSNAVYGEPLRDPVDETHPLRPLTPYGLSKYGQEQLVHAFCKSRRLPLVILRLGWVYGPGTPEDRALVIFIRRVLSGLPITLANSRSVNMPLIHQTDIARITAALLEDGHGTFNLAEETRVCLWDYVQMVMEVVGKKTEVVCKDRPDAPLGMRLSYQKLWERYGLRPEVSLREGVASVFSSLQQGSV
jgi:UDP-glucose 4-epimerase